MAVIVSMLRGVNVVGRNMIKMETLRALYEKLGFENPKTYINSGNVVFKTRMRSLSEVTKRIETAIEEEFGFRPHAIARTIPELRAVIANYPFAKRRALEPHRVLVTFLADHPAAEAREKILKMKIKPEEVHFVGRELFIYFPNGQARPTFSWSVIERLLATPTTGRNWNSVTKLLEIAERFEVD
jgi:uncharacterized protein (DUF1697 family)